MSAPFRAWRQGLPAAGARAAPPLRIVGALAALVLLAHALVLGTSPSHVGPALAPAAPERVAAMSTRRIALAPPAPPAPTAPAPPAPAATPALPAMPAAVAKPPAAVPPRAQPRPAVPPQPQAQAALKKNPAPAQQAPAPSLDAPAPDEIQSSSADLFTGIEDGSGRDGPATQTKPEPPGASSVEPSTAPLTSTPAAPPANSASTSQNQNQNQNQSLATALPASVQLDYHLTGRTRGLSPSGQAELLWHNSAGRYDASMTLTLPFGARSMSSQGQVGPEGLAPSRFTDKSRSEVAAHFEPDKGQISFSANTPSVPWIQGAQDRLSVLMQLGGMLAGKPGAFPVGTTISVYTVGPRDAESWTFRVEGEEMLSLPWGELAALKLSRQLRHEDDHKLEVWYAPALGYVPVRNKITQANGDFVDQQLSALTQP